MNESAIEDIDIKELDNNPIIENFYQQTKTRLEGLIDGWSVNKQGSKAMLIDSSKYLYFITPYTSCHYKRISALHKFFLIHSDLSTHNMKRIIKIIDLWLEEMTEQDGD